MTKVIRIVQTYLFYSLPFILICMAWGSIKPERDILTDATFFTKVAWEVLSWNLMLWFIVLIVFLLLLVLIPEAREKTLKRLANLKERDEREQYITGKASRSAYISTLSLLIFLLFISIFSLNISKIPDHEIKDGKSKTLSIGLGFSLLDESKVKMDSTGNILFETKDIPLSKSAILLILIGWQLVSFNLSARRES